MEVMRPLGLVMEGMEKWVGLMDDQRNKSIRDLRWKYRRIHRVTENLTRKALISP